MLTPYGRPIILVEITWNNALSVQKQTKIWRWMFDFGSVFRLSHATRTLRDNILHLTLAVAQVWHPVDMCNVACSTHIENLWNQFQIKCAARLLDTPSVCMSVQNAWKVLLLWHQWCTQWRSMKYRGVCPLIFQSASSVPHRWAKWIRKCDREIEQELMDGG